MSDSPPSFRVEQIDHVELFVPDRYEAAAWYRRVLGLEVLSRFETWAQAAGGPLMLSSDGGDTKLALFEGKPQGSLETVGFRRLAFRVGGTTFIEFLKRIPALDLIDHRGQPVTGTPMDHDQAFSVYFCDPYGHRLEVTSYEHETIRAVVERPR